MPAQVSGLHHITAIAIDEPLEQLGTILGLPPHLAPRRADIEAAWPALD